MPRQAVDLSKAVNTKTAAILTTPWKERPLLQMQTASEVTGVSIASLYRFANEGRLQLRRLAGRTLVVTEGIVALVDAAEAWTPSNRGNEARIARKEIARAAFER